MVLITVEHESRGRIKYIIDSPAITWPCTLSCTPPSYYATLHSHVNSQPCACAHIHARDRIPLQISEDFFLKKMSAGSLSLWKQDMQRSDQTQVQQLALKVQFVTTVWALKASTTPNTVLLSC